MDRKWTPLSEMYKERNSKIKKNIKFITNRLNLKLKKKKWKLIFLNSNDIFPNQNDILIFWSPII